MQRVRLALVICVSAVLLTESPAVRAEVSFRGLPAATDVASSQAALELRIARVLAYWSAQQRRRFPSHPDSRLFAQIAMAKLAAGEETDDINRALLNESARAFSAYGTQISVIPGVCARRGDYDFMAQDLVRLAYTSPLALWPATARKIAFALLPESGTRHQRMFWLGLCGRHRETENHLLMIESSRYLTNQLRQKLAASARYDNARNGFDRWMTRHLAGFLRGHFEEYNARPYQGYTVNALNNLHSFAEAPEVARSAGMVLDYLSAVFAVQSNGLRRHGPFRRQARYADSAITYDHDTESARFALLAGNYQYLAPFAGKVPYGSHFMLSAALSSYRVPDVILDLMVRKDQGPYYQRFHHDGVEVYASSPSYLLSAGGVFVRHFAFGSTEQHGWARATTVIPSGSTSSDTRAFVRIEGAREPGARNNSCVAPNFACGTNVVIPKQYDRCRVREEGIDFVDFARCDPKLGFYAAARVQKCDGPRCAEQASNFGALELREASQLSFASFRHLVKSHNRRQPFRGEGLSHYVTSDGHQYAFEALAERTSWPIVAIDGVAQLRSFARWPLAEGDIVHAAGDGLVTVDNPFRGERLVLDARDAVHPRRSLKRLPQPANGAVAER